MIIMIHSVCVCATHKREQREREQREKQRARGGYFLLSGRHGTDTTEKRGSVTKPHKTGTS